MWQNGALYYLLSDYLGSTSLVIRDIIAGMREEDIAAEIRYKPCGEVRYSSDPSPTQFQYTEQYS